jgi:hypothetical protein
MAVALVAGMLLFGSIWVVSSQQPPAGYVYKPLRPTGWTAPMRPFTRLAGISPDFSQMV